MSVTGPPEFALRGCLIRGDKKGVWIEAERAAVEDCFIYIETNGRTLFAIDDNRKRLKKSEALVRILVPKR